MDDETKEWVEDYFSDRECYEDGLYILTRKRETRTTRVDTACPWCKRQMHARQFDNEAWLTCACGYEEIVQLKCNQFVRSGNIRQYRAFRYYGCETRYQADKGRRD